MLLHMLLSEVQTFLCASTAELLDVIAETADTIKETYEPRLFHFVPAETEDTLVAAVHESIQKVE